MLYVEILLRQPWVRTALLVSLVAGLLLLVGAPRDKRWALAGATWSLGLVVSVTMFTPDVAGEGSGRWQCDARVDFTMVQVLMTTEGWLNVVLFTPLGFFISRLTNRWAWGLAAGFALSLLVELWQGAQGGIHVCSINDLAFNAAGALLGSLLSRAWRDDAKRHGRAVV